jgi:caffeoyl-CoA O-methyltransferase
VLDKYPRLTPELYEYVLDHGTRRDDVLRRVERETAELGDVAAMQVAPDQGAFMTMLTRLLGARDVIEVGTFTGYSAICFARGLAPGGRLLCCEIDPRWAEVARSNLTAAGVADRVDIRVGPALGTLRALPAEPGFDLAFVDADKTGYPDYYEELLLRLRPGGVLLLDNVLLGGRVLEPEAGDESAAAMAALNRRIAEDPRVELAMLAIADGITLARRRPADPG